MISQKRRQWHNNCTCTCTFCTVCNHSASCSEACCPNCFDDACPLETTDDAELWTVPEVNKSLSSQADKAPNQMVHVQNIGSRSAFLQAWHDTLEKAVDHKHHTVWQKNVIETLKTNLPLDTFMTRWDFLMNYTHISSIEVGNAFYGRRQSTVLIATIWYHDESSTEQKPVIKKLYHAFVSPYLTHSSLFFQKAFSALLPHLPLSNDACKCIILTDGGMQHFKNRISMHWGTKAFQLFKLQLRWIIDPAYHGKGECDGRGALLKKFAKVHILKEDGFIDNAEQLAEFFATVPGGGSSVLNISWDDLEEDVTRINGIKACYDFCFLQETNKLSMRKWPCVCNHCLAFDFLLCTSQQTVGRWMERETKVISINHPKGIAPPADESRNYVHYEVEKIISKRTFRGQVQYKIKWRGWDEEYDEWKFIKELDCSNLIDDFEEGFCQ